MTFRSDNPAAPEDRSALLIGALASGVCEISPDSVIVSANPAARRMLGMPEQGSVAIRLDTFVDPGGAIMKAVSETFANGAGSVVTGAFLSDRAGDDFPAECEISPLRDAQGVFGVCLAFRSIAERLRIKQELRHSRDVLRGVIDNTDIAIFIKDSSGRYTLANAAYGRLLGVAPTAIVGATDFDFFAAPVAEGHLAQDETARRSGTIFRTEETVPVAGGERTFVTTKFALCETDGTPYGVVGMAADITDLKRAEAEALRGREILDGMLRNTPAIIYVKDLEGRYTYGNTEWGKTVGVDVDKGIGMTDLDIFPRQDAERLRSDDRGVIASGKLRRWEETVDIAGVKRWFLSAKLPLRDTSGRIEALLGISTEITDMRLMEQELSRRVAELAQAHLHAERIMEDLRLQRSLADKANHAKSEFLATMSHEIRTPMNGVSGMLDLLRESSLTPDQRTMTEIARESAQALLRVVDDLLDFSKIEAGRMTLEIIPASVADIVEGVAETLLTEAVKRGVRLSLHIDPAIPASILTDPIRLRQILFNVAGNAIKFSVSTGRVPQVSIRAERPDGNRVRIIIADNGIGMTPETVANLFVPFSQGEISTTRRFGGTGLGLAISRRLAAMLDAEISVDSRENAGSTFVLTLPAKEVVRPGGTGAPDLAGIRVAIRIRDDVVADSVADYCRASGASCLRIRDPEPAPVGAILVADAPDEESSARPVDGAAPAVWLSSSPTVRLRRAPAGGMTVSSAPLRRSLFLQALAVTAGRAEATDIHEDRPATAGYTPPSEEEIREARLANRLILVAEDNATNREVIRRQLRHLGHVCETVDDGVAALERLTGGGGYAMLLTDCHMPRMDGFELVRRIRETERPGDPRLTVIAITASALEGESARCLAAGMDDYLPKPIETARLRRMLAARMPHSGKTPPAAILPVNPAALREIIGDDLVARDEVLADFVKRSRVIVDDILGTGLSDPAAVKFGAHKLKSSARIIGAENLASLCEKLESASHHTDSAMMSTLLQALPDRFSAVSDHIAALIRRTVS